MNNRLTAKHLFFLFGLLLSVINVFANENENEDGLGGIKGKVATTDNKPASMVTVTIKGTKKNTITGDDGLFLIRNMAPGNYELEISLVGL